LCPTAMCDEDQLDNHILLNHVEDQYEEGEVSDWYLYPQYRSINIL
jgi:cellobiose phosphorylase